MERVKDRVKKNIAIAKKKRLVCSILVAMFVLLAAGCTSSKTVTYNVETGDSISIKLDTSEGYDISTDVPFTISQNDETISQGTFITAESYQQYVDAVKSTEGVTIIDSGENDTCEYLMWNSNDTEYDYVVLIKESNTGVLIGNNVSEKSAKECFNRLTISIAK